MITSTTRHSQNTIGLGKLLLIGACALALTLAAAVGVRSLDSDGSSPAPIAVAAPTYSQPVQPFLYVVESPEQAEAIRMWHVADASTTGLPFDVLVAGTSEEDANVDMQLRDIQMYEGFGNGPRIVDFRVR